MFTLTYFDDAGRVAWMGDVGCATAVRALVNAAQTIREKPHYASAEISDRAQLIRRLTREEVLQQVDKTCTSLEAGVTD